MYNIYYKSIPHKALSDTVFNRLERIGIHKMKKLGLLASAMILLLSGCSMQEATSVGIIGGADAPTFFFLVSSFLFEIIGAALILIIIAFIIALVLVKKKKM